MSASADLGETIRDALDRSEALIVLCSPTAAESRWVDREIAYFIQDRGPGAVICVITPATPHAATLTDVMPATLRGALPEGVEPLAVDLRRDADGKRLARLKIAARLLNVSLDQLVQRDARRRLRVMAAFTTLAAVVTLGMGAMTIATLKSRQIAREQRDETEALVAYMLGDLRQQLEPVGRLDLMDGVSAKVLAYYAKARTDRLDDNALAQRAKAQTLLGTIREQRGDLAGAQDAFGQAAATTHALVERDPKNGERIFDEAQNVFWLGYVQWRRGDIVGAERGFKDYDRLARTLVRLDPNRADWRVEVAYAQNNLGTLLFEQGRPEEALSAFRAALAVLEAEHGRAPGAKLAADTANSHAWIADTLLRLGRVSDALVEREAVTRMLSEASDKNPKDKRLAAKAVGTQLALARLRLDAGQPDQARTLSDESNRKLRELAALDPTNARWGEYLVIAQMDRVDLELWSGDVAAARLAHHAAAASFAKLRAEEPAPWRTDLDGRMGKQAAMLARRTGDDAEARRLAQDLIGHLTTVTSSRETKAERAAMLGLAQLWVDKPSETIAILSAQEKSLPPEGRDTLARAYLATGKRNQAESLARDLKKHGYAHPGFLAFWRDSPVGGIFGREALK